MGSPARFPHLDVQVGNRFWIIASGLVWLLGIGLALTVFFSYNNLRSELAQKNLAIANAETELRSKQADLDGLAERIARQQSQFATLEDAVIEVTLFLDQNSGQKDLVQRLCNQNGKRLAGLALTICANVHNVLGDSYYSYLQTVLQATLFRSTDKFKSAGEKYLSAQSQIEKVSAPPQHRALLQALSFEGQAYSAYRQDQLTAARGLIDDAQRVLKPYPNQVSGFVALTDLKIACDSKIPKAEISEKYQQYKRDLEKAVGSASGAWIDYRKRDLTNFENDPELRLVCPELITAS